MLCSVHGAYLKAAKPGADCSKFHAGIPASSEMVSEEAAGEGGHVEISFDEDADGSVRISVADDGDGIAPELLDRIWGYDSESDARTVDVHIRRLRSKLEDSTHTFIETVRNIGYKFKESV